MKVWLLSSRNTGNGDFRWNWVSKPTTLQIKKRKRSFRGLMPLKLLSL
ncbi:DUF7279 family protein [Nafulsella turpanensis]